jgi:hypothetical protein
MAPEWARAVRPLVLVFTAIAVVVTLIFRANVDAQGGAYATGVLVLMTSAAIAVAISIWRRGARGARIIFALIALVFVYTTVVNVFERPEGLKIASFFIAAIVVSSFISRIYRSTELRAERVDLDPTAQRFIDEASQGTIRIIASHRHIGDALEYARKEQRHREDNHIPAGDPVLFLEVHVCDPSEFYDVVEVRGVNVGGYHVLRAESSAVPNAIAALLLFIRDTTGRLPHCYFSWTEGSPLVHLMRFILSGEADTAPVTREILRKAEPDPERRPVIHAGG